MRVDDFSGHEADNRYEPIAELCHFSIRQRTVHTFLIIRKKMMI